MTKTDRGSALGPTTLRRARGQAPFLARGHVAPHEKSGPHGQQSRTGRDYTVGHARAIPASSLLSVRLDVNRPRFTMSRTIPPLGVTGWPVGAGALTGADALHRLGGMRRYLRRVALFTGLLMLTVVACSSNEQKPSTSTSPPTSTSELPPLPAEPAQPGAVGVSPGGVTTRVDVPADATESQYGQACHAAKVWMDSQQADPKTLVEPYLKMVQEARLHRPRKLQHAVGQPDTSPAGGRHHGGHRRRQRRVRVVLDSENLAARS